MSSSRQEKIQRQKMVPAQEESDLLLCLSRHRARCDCDRTVQHHISPPCKFKLSQTPFYHQSPDEARVVDRPSTKRFLCLQAKSFFSITGVNIGRGERQLSWSRMQPVHLVIVHLYRENCAFSDRRSNHRRRRASCTSILPQVRKSMWFGFT